MTVLFKKGLNIFISERALTNMACSQQIAIQQAGGRSLLYRALVARQNFTCKDPVIWAQFDACNSQPILCSWSKVRENHTTTMQLSRLGKKQRYLGIPVSKNLRTKKRKVIKEMVSVWIIPGGYSTCFIQGGSFPPAPPPQGLTLYPFIHPFWQKKYSFHIPSGNCLFSISPFRSFNRRK